MRLHAIPQDDNSVLLTWLKKTYRRHSFEIRGSDVWERCNESEIHEWIRSETAAWWTRSMEN